MSLSLISMSEYLFENYRTYREGALTKLRQKLVCESGNGKEKAVKKENPTAQNQINYEAVRQNKFCSVGGKENIENE